MKHRKIRRRPTKRNIKRRKLIIIAIVSIAIALCYILIKEELTERNGSWHPDYSKISLTEIINKDKLAEDDYHTIFLQTGLGRPAVDHLLQNNEKGILKEELFEEYQRDFFGSGKYECRQIGIITSEEKIRDEKGEVIAAFTIADLQDGDILITKATHSLGWRHGHAAIVTDAAKGETLEAVLLGFDSVLQSVEKWRSYPSFMVLRLKEGSEIKGKEIANYAQKSLANISYGLLTGIPIKAPEEIKKTQCAHLVWYPYARFGYDIDSDGSWLVTPKDIANSDFLEIVQVYGVNPEGIWP